MFLHDGLCLRGARLLRTGLLCEAAKLQARHCTRTPETSTPCSSLLCLPVAHCLEHFPVACMATNFVQRRMLQAWQRDTQPATAGGGHLGRWISVGRGESTPQLTAGNESCAQQQEHYSRSRIEGYPLGQVSAWWQTAVPKGRLRSAQPEHPVQGMWQLSYLASPSAGTSRPGSAVPLDQSQAAWAYLQQAGARNITHGGSPWSACSYRGPLRDGTANAQGVCGRRSLPV